MSPSPQRTRSTPSTTDHLEEKDQEYGKVIIEQEKDLVTKKQGEEEEDIMSLLYYDLHRSLQLVFLSLDSVWPSKIDCINV